MDNWDALEQRCRECTRCALHNERTNCVFGTGSREAKLMFVGEAPGAKEDETGIPFVGAAGKLLDKYHPTCLVHGHVHMNYGRNIPRELDYNGTKIINAYERYVFEIPDREHSLRDYGQVIYKTRYRPGYLEDYTIQGR